MQDDWFVFSFVFQIFNGNSGREDVVKHSLESFTRARFVRFQPTEFHNRKTLRVEIYGVPVPAGRVNPFPSQGLPIDEENRLALYRVRSVRALSAHLAVKGLIE